MLTCICTFASLLIVIVRIVVKMGIREIIVIVIVVLVVAIALTTIFSLETEEVIAKYPKCSTSGHLSSLRCQCLPECFDLEDP